MSHIFYAKKCYYEASAAAGALLFLTSEIVEQRLFADKDFAALALAGTNVADTPLRDQFADGMLGMPLIALVHSLIVSISIGGVFAGFSAGSSSTSSVRRSRMRSMTSCWFRFILVTSLILD